MATPIKDLTELSKAYKGYTVLRFNQEIKQLTEKLEYLNIKIVKELNPCPGEDEQVVRVFECTKDNEDVLVDFFTKDNHIDAYYESSDKLISYSNEKPTIDNKKEFFNELLDELSKKPSNNINRLTSALEKYRD